MPIRRKDMTWNCTQNRITITARIDERQVESDEIEIPSRSMISFFFLRRYTTSPFLLKMLPIRTITKTMKSKVFSKSSRRNLNRKTSVNFTRSIRSKCSAAESSAFSSELNLCCHPLETNEQEEKICREVDILY